MKNSFEIWIAEWRHAKCCINFYHLISDMIDNLSFFFRSRILKSRKWKSFSRSMSILLAVMINQTGLQNWTKPSKKKAAVTASSISPYLPLSMRRSHWISRLSVCPKGESFISLNIKLSQSLNLNLRFLLICHITIFDWLLDHIVVLYLQRQMDTYCGGEAVW